MTWLSRFACGGGVLLMLVGCGESGDEGPQSPLNEEQARDRAGEHINETVTALPDSLELERLGGSSAPCENDEYITVSKRYWLDGLPAEENEEHVEALHEYWSANGYTVEADQRPDDQFISVRHDEDKFTMSVRESKQGDLSLGASSPCIDENGTDG
ncbi:hypothetical protein F4561_005929 [Lipingzhangella halophila]|uniref:Lipoprotein n=1 Tax=Lipingzhangella halophila TaxID=1783352 RepID=A0A7W7RN47_9ACTN|nr:hypothetical protein [Lipingzhangella halophila]MBB4935035.1 hypothetical protein [Lipingzhangella halophila]